MRRAKLIKVVIFSISYFLITTNCFSQGAALNTTGSVADPSAALDVSSNNSGMLIPRMTKVQKNNIALPAEGLLIYQTDDTIGFWYYSSGWKQIAFSSGNGMPTGNSIGNTLYWDGSKWIDSPNIYNNGGSVGIGTNNPNAVASLELSGISKGFLLNRMTTAERNAIVSPIDGLQIYNTTNNCIEFYGNGVWNKISCAYSCGDDYIDDRDGSSYNTLKIGNQCWMKENLKYLPSVTGSSSGSTTIPYYYVYGYNGTDINTAKQQTNYSVYGVLYNWPAAMAGHSSSINNPSGVQGICPDGWHLPSDAEWVQLFDYVSSNSQYWCGGISSQITKSLASTLNWGASSAPCAVGNNTSLNNTSDFSALPSGYRDPSGVFSAIGLHIIWWSTDEDGSSAWRSDFTYANSQIHRNALVKDYGFSVRCLKN